MSDGGDGGGGGWVDSIWNVPGMSRLPRIPHYYGDYARQLMIAAAALILIGAPIYGNNLRVEFPFIVLGSLIIVGLAALINPRDMWVSAASTIFSGVGVLAYGAWGMFEYSASNPITFILRLAIAIVFLFAFYFSLKTVRSFLLNQIGKREAVDEFESEEEKARADKLEHETMILKDLDS